MNYSEEFVSAKSGKHVVDSNGWIAYIEDDGKRADLVESVLLDTENLIVPTIVFFEVFKFMERKYDAQKACQVGFMMKKAHIVDLDFVLAFQAADLSLDYGLSMADAMILAVARAYRARLHTFDSHFAKVSGVNYLGDLG